VEANRKAPNRVWGEREGDWGEPRQVQGREALKKIYIYKKTYIIKKII
jgi:hypothetical protein